MARSVIKGMHAATMARGGYGLVRNAAIAIDGDRIVWVGSAAALPAIYDAWEMRDLEGQLATPGMIDCHTHLVHGGNRAEEFEKRLQGLSYEEIARAGGGIMSTVTATRALDEKALTEASLPRLDALIREGVTTVEVKSGYGLDRETELKMLRVARRLSKLRNVTVRTSFLGAHTIPPELKGRARDYIADICIPTLKAAHAEGLVDAVDGFCEGIAFTAAELKPVFQTAQYLGLPVKLHAEQLSHSGGVALATKFGAMSVDHLEYASAKDVRAMAAAGTVAVLLPGAYYTLQETQKPPVSAFRAAGVTMALATDNNPGSSPMTSLLLAMNMGCTFFGLTPEEALFGVTHGAALALGFSDRGKLAPGAVADLAIWDVESPAELSYRIGYNPLKERIFGGAK